MGASVLLGRLRRTGRLALTAAEFETFLQVLHPADRAAAGERYEALRRRLLIVFAARHCGGDTAALADETFDRVARRLQEGMPLESSIETFVLGVARNVVREQWKSPKEVELPVVLRAAVAEEDGAAALEAACLEKCLSELQPRPRDWVLRFYSGTGGAKIAARKGLASELGLDLNALRVRLFRIRAKLETCVNDCVAAGGNDSAKGAIPKRAR